MVDFVVFVFWPRFWFGVLNFVCLLWWLPLVFGCDVPVGWVYLSVFVVVRNRLVLFVELIRLNFG